mgnify:CR=1 FL=1
MKFVRRAVFVSLVLMPLLAFGQADQAIISVSDVPDPVAPGDYIYLLAPPERAEALPATPKPPTPPTRPNPRSP